MKKYLVYAGMFVASFLVINVGMYFLLSFTQPEIAAVPGMEGDSLLAESAADSVIAETPETPRDELIASSGEAAPETLIAPQPLQQMPQIAEVVIIDSSKSKSEEPPPAVSTAQEVAQPQIAESVTPDEKTLPQPETDAQQTPPRVSPPVQQPDVQALQTNPKELVKLAKLLEGMKPDEAAAIASRLQIDDIVALMMKMKDRKAAKMMAALPIEKAARVAERMSAMVSSTGVKS